MARKDILINLNGGDTVTADADLLFQFHDASDDSIIATANYAAIGSENNEGTDGANLTFDSTTTVGKMLITGVDIGAVTSVKVKVKDEDDNESDLSGAFVLLADYYDVTVHGMTMQSSALYDSISSYSDNWGVSVFSYSGDFTFETEIENVDTDNLIIGISEDNTGRTYNDANPWDYVINKNTSALPFRHTSFGASLTVSAITPTNTLGDKLLMRRIGTTLDLVYLSGATEIVIHSWLGVTTNAMYLFFLNNTGKVIREPKIM